MNRKKSFAIVDSAFLRCWNSHTSVQMDNNVRDVLVDVVEQILNQLTKPQKKKAPSMTKISRTKTKKRKTSK